MLTIHVLNVGHGHSAIVEFDNGAEKVFGVVDSNVPKGETEPRALTKLRQLGAKRLSFVCLTHPHTDHFKGLYRIIQAYDGSIDYFFSCPFGGLIHNRARLKKLAEKLREIKNSSEGEPVKEAVELLSIIKWADERARARSLDWHECAGEYLALGPTGFSGVSIATILPPNRAKGGYIQQIERQDGFVLNTFRENEISLALQFSYGGTAIVLGGDGTVANWRDRRRWETNTEAPIMASVVNLPHHGSRRDCPDDVLAQLFSVQGDRAGITSADGHSHPSIEVIKWMEQHGVKPYCTNLIPQCGANAQKLVSLPNLDPRLQRWIREVATGVDTVQPCQGDVSIVVDEAGNTSLERQYKNACAYRGDYAAFGGPQMTSSS
ncbi:MULTISPECIES: MBL fold metallo-hydrolase [unclassified Bradyrhizobium]|uniref:MBL fold metallo-hydrolase n=1 Tax=unclassified Bradyrhizobium TaxID=2631580 RepID=UPI0028E8D49A|nr:MULTISPECIES: MBL fold metallo-hydrolase [unclassified Bradyrhizobium]